MQHVTFLIGDVSLEWRVVGQEMSIFGGKGKPQENPYSCLVCKFTDPTMQLLSKS
jgi:hypothetical protein